MSGENKNNYYITTTIPYANAPPHIGFALEIIIADVIARWNRLSDKNVFFLTGTDEHGSKNSRMAKEANLSTLDFVTFNSNKFKELADLLNISNSFFIRTTDQNKHWPGVYKVWNTLLENGDIYKKKYSGYYCSGCETFVTEKDLVNGKCPNHPNRELELISEENYFFKLSKYSDDIRELIESDKLLIRPVKWKNDFLGLIKDGLTDVSFSRDKKHLDWGISVPNDDSQVIYVWCDALVNYLTGINFPDSSFDEFWPADIHVVGKDMLRFHAGIWPGMLLSFGLPLPKQIVVHGFLTVEGQKMGKSLGNAVDPFFLINSFGADALRYVLMRSVPFGDDGDFSSSLLIERNNSELVNGLGNLLNRTLTLIEKKLGGKIDSFVLDSSLVSLFPRESIFSNFADNRFHMVLTDIFSFIGECNKYVNDKRPWELEGDELINVLGNLAESLRVLSIFLYPFIPSSAEKIAEQLNYKISSFEDSNFSSRSFVVSKGGFLFSKFDLPK